VDLEPRADVTSDSRALPDRDGDGPSAWTSDGTGIAVPQAAAKAPARATGTRKPAAKPTAARVAKPAAAPVTEPAARAEGPAEKPAGSARKPAARKPLSAAPAAGATEKLPVAPRKPAARKPAASKPAASKPAAIKTAARKPAAASKAAAAPEPVAPEVAGTPETPGAPRKPPPRTPTKSTPKTPAAPRKAAANLAQPANPTQPAVVESAVAPTVQPEPVKVTRPAVAQKEPRGADTVTEPAPTSARPDTVLVIERLFKRFGDTVAVSGIDLTVHTGSIFGLVGPNGAGKTTTLSMVTGLLRPDAGRILVHGADVWNDPVVAKRNMGVLPDRLRLFDRLTGAQLLHYSGTLRGIDRATVAARSADLANAFGLEDALGRLVTDYSAGMSKKIALAAAMIHSPRILILDEPFEAVDPVSAANVIEILQKYAAAGGTVVLSSHSMDLIQRICDSVAIVVRGELLAHGTMEDVRAGATLEDRFVALAGGRKAAEGMEWLHSFSD
jgi:ABC-type multidrug transport system ATPase subunit